MRSAEHLDSGGHQAGRSELLSLALQQLEITLTKLDEACASAHIAAHVQMAIDELREAIGRP